MQAVGWVCGASGWVDLHRFADPTYLAGRSTLLALRVREPPGVM